MFQDISICLICALLSRSFAKDGQVLDQTHDRWVGMLQQFHDFTPSASVGQREKGIKSHFRK
ncbi:hypothetical protein SDC9_189123 [bioreactor metagenome]|uniref:Uncharacterized protein n=1 Tax=bioreactor metagenome TaxID=1076179 RepID=A0A645HRV0_9ZZZZ